MDLIRKYSFIIAIFLAIIGGWGIYPDISKAGIPRTYIVQSGDTLSGIAEKFLGNYKEYKYLATINNLEIQTIEGIDYVWLRVGQVIKLRTDLEVATALEVLDELVEQRVRLFRSPEYDSYQDATDAYYSCIRDLYHTIDISEGYKQRQELLGLMRKIRKAWDSYGAHRIISTFSQSVYLTFYNITEVTGDDLLERGLQLLAILEIESGYENVPGRHDERGWYQIKPASWEYYNGKIISRYFSSIDDGGEIPMIFSGTPEIIENTFIDATIWTGWFLKYLIETEGSFRKAAERYNNGIDKQDYAAKIIKCYNHLTILANKIREKYDN